MKMTKPIKVALGIFTFFTVVFPFFIMPAFILFFMSTSGFPFVHPYSTMNPESFDKSFPTILLVLYPAIMCFSLSQLALQVAYIVLAVKNKVLTDVYRILFIIGMFFMPYIAMPIYFVVYIWKEGAQIEGFQDSEINSGKSIKQIIVKTQKREDKTPKSSSVKNNISKTKKATAVKKSTRSKK